MSAQIFKIDKIKRLIIKPMIDRGWKPPSGGNLDVITQDYIDVLGHYSEDVLESTFLYIRSKHKYKSWPSVSEFDAAAKQFYEPPHNYGTSTDGNSGLRTKKANEYATQQINTVFEQAWGEGWQKLAREWIVSQALYQLKEGTDPHVPRESWPVEQWREEISHRSRNYG